MKKCNVCNKVYANRFEICTCGRTLETIDRLDKEDLGKSIKTSQPTTPQPTPPQVACPKCGSTQIQIVPRKWSLMTGIFTNKVDRVCVNCKCKF